MTTTIIRLDDMSIVPLDPEPYQCLDSSTSLRTGQSPHHPRTSLARCRPKSNLCSVPFSQSPYLSINTQQPRCRGDIEDGSSQTTVVDSSICLTPIQPAVAKQELFLHITPLPHESPADALTRHYSLSSRDIDAIANNLMLDPEQRQRLPQRCCPVDLQHHIQKELMRRVHLGIDIGIPHHHTSHHRRFLLSDSPFTFEIRETKPARSKANDEKHPAGPGKYAFKKPVADLSEQLAHEAEKKSATWMELFFDLAFVANITIFTHQHPIINATTMFRYCGWFTIMWWMWLSQTMFDVRFSTDDLLNRIWKLIQLFALAGFAGNGDHFTSSNSNGFALSYAVMKLVLVGQYFIVWIHAPNSRCRRPILLYMLANFISFVMWWTSAFLVEALSNQARYSIWFGAIGIEVLATIALTNNATVTFIGSHLPERLGLFTLIILGESVMGIFMVTDDLVDAPGKLGWDNLTMLIFSITIVKCQWFLYFDDYHEQVPHRSSIHSALWTYLHFMLNLSQLLLGVGCLDLIRIYQLTKSSADGSIMVPGHHEYGAHYPDGAHEVGGAPVSERASTSSFGPNGFDDGPTADRVLIYVKQYYLIVAASVFFWNATIKFVTSRPGDKYDRAIYLSRFFMSFVVICLLLVEHQQLGAFSLLGLEVGSCLLQVGHDLLVLYYAARKDMNVEHHPSQ